MQRFYVVWMLAGDSSPEYVLHIYGPSYTFDTRMEALDKADHMNHITQIGRYVVVEGTDSGE